MKRLIFVALVIFVFAMPASAQQNYSDDIEQIAQDNGIDFEQLIAAPFETLWDTAKQNLLKNTENPARIFVRITAILLVTSFVNFFAEDKLLQVAKTVNAVAVLVIFSNVFTNFADIAQQTEQVLFDIKNFMISFLPVFAGVSFASGEMVTSTVYTGFFLVAVVSVANFCISWIIPSLNIFLALGVVSSVSTIVNIKPVCEIYTKMIKTAMTASVSILCFVLSLQTAITQGQDSLAIKTGKMIVTTAVPVIGSALQGAVGSVYASMSVLKGFCGLTGVAVIIGIFLPLVATLGANWIGFMAVSVIGTMLENTMAQNILAVFKDITEIMLSMTVLFAVLLLFSLTIMIKTVQVV